MTKVRSFIDIHFINILLILILGGRFYFVFGFTGMLKPVVDLNTILMKDLVYVALTLGVVLVYKKDYLLFLEKYKRIFLLIVGVATVTVLMHLFGKSVYQITWHYVRNIYMYLFLIPTVYVLTKNKKIQIKTIINSLLLLNLIFSLAQLFWFQEGLLDGTRPLGIVGDPIISSMLNYFLLFKMVFEKLDVYKISLLVIISMCLDAQASVTAMVSVVLALILVLAVHWKLLFPHFKKMLFVSTLFIVIVFAGIKRNDLSDRLFGVFVGTIGKKIGYSDPLRYNDFENLSSERVDLLKQNNFITRDIKINLTFLAGDIYHPEYYRLDSNFISLFKNMGIINLVLYYLFLFYILQLTIKSRMGSRHEIFFFTMGIFFLSFFCATIYKFPTTQILYLFLAQMLYWPLDRKPDSVT